MHIARIIVSIICLSVIASTTHANHPVLAKTFVVQFRLLEGNPDGNREAGTLKVLAEPVIATRDGRTARFHSGGEKPLRNANALGFAATVPVGTSIEFTPQSLDDGKVFVELMAEVSQLAQAGESRIATSGRIVRFKGTLKLAEIATVQLGKDARGQQTWVEITIRDAKEFTLRTAGSRDEAQRQ